MKIKLYFLKNIFPRKLRKTDNVFQGRKGRYLGNTVPERGRKHFRIHDVHILSMDLGNTVPERGRKQIASSSRLSQYSYLGNTVPERGRKPNDRGMTIRAVNDLGNTIPERGRKHPYSFLQISHTRI